MKLKDFIKETLIEIAEGIYEAKDHVGDKVAIAPHHIDGSRVDDKTFIDFDIAVTVNETSYIGKKGKAGINAQIEVLGNQLKGDLGGSGDKSRQLQREQVSRIQFQVPVFLSAKFNHKINQKGPSKKEV